MATVLLHICCGPCATVPYPSLVDEGFDVTGYFYNPNIHPYTEYQKRLEGLRQYSESQGMQVIHHSEYAPVDYFQHVCYRESRRCQLCYQLRLDKTARIARSGHFDFFTTTLLVSPYQKHELIRAAGEACADQYGVPFLYRDFRPGFRDTVVRSKEAGLYRQQYCGCLYSEVERYGPKTTPKNKGKGSEPVA